MGGVGSMAKRRLKDALPVCAAMVLLLVITMQAAAFAMNVRAYERDAAEYEQRINARYHKIVGSQTLVGDTNVFLDYDALQPSGVRMQLDLRWSDDWFFEDSYRYNHDLALAGCVLADLANSESAHFVKSANADSYMEKALAALGFDHLSTDTYKYRSEILDEVVGIFTSGTNVTAYTIADKRIANSVTGEQRNLVMVAIRGSYGSEWIANAALDANGKSWTRNKLDHPGFAQPCSEIMRKVLARIDGLKQDGVDTSVLICGHSRGGAVANLACAELTRLASEGGVALSDQAIYGYSFATPLTTTEKCATDPLYRNAFNVLNPSDLVTHLPLASWGYRRYGTELRLPDSSAEDFAVLYARMQECYLANTQRASAYDPADVAAVEALVQKLSGEFPQSSDFLNPVGLAKTCGALLFDVNVVRVLQGHLPGTYIAWLQATDRDDLCTRV